MKKDKHDPYENRTKCYSCKTKGYLKIIKTENTNTDIVRYINDMKYVFNLEPPRLECLCQNCGIISSYSICAGLFVDGVIKEI